MRTNYLYVAQNVSNRLTRKHNVYKVGHSLNPLKRIETLGSSGTTDVFEQVVILPLPLGVRDVHVLEHPSVKPFVLKYMDDTNKIKKSYISSFGSDGIHRRRELLAFGKSSSRKKVVNLFKTVVGSMCTKEHLYKCPSNVCSFNGNTDTYCGVCTKYIRSIYNGFAYLNMKKHLESIPVSRKRTRDVLVLSEKMFSSLSKKKKQKTRDDNWDGPLVHSFWAFKYYNRMFDTFDTKIGEVVSVNPENRTSRVKWWFPVNGTNYRSKLTTGHHAKKPHIECIGWSSTTQFAWVQQIRMTKKMCIFKKDQHILKNNGHGGHRLIRMNIK